MVVALALIADADPPRPLRAKRRPRYRAYIGSRAWEVRRRYLFAIRPDRGCQRCGKLDQPLECHHVHYRTLGEETLADVRFLCKEPCHGIEDAERAAREQAAAERRREAWEEEQWEREVDRFCARKWGKNWEACHGFEWGENAYHEELDRRDREEAARSR